VSQLNCYCRHQKARVFVWSWCWSANGECIHSSVYSVGKITVESKTRSVNLRESLDLTGLQWLTAVLLSTLYQLYKLCIAQWNKEKHECWSWSVAKEVVVFYLKILCGSANGNHLRPNVTDWHNAKGCGGVRFKSSIGGPVSRLKLFCGCLIGVRCAPIPSRLSFTIVSATVRTSAVCTVVCCCSRRISQQHLATRSVLVEEEQPLYDTCACCSRMERPSGRRIII
jgi:hypothetical protein